MHIGAFLLNFKAKAWHSQVHHTDKFVPYSGVKKNRAYQIFKTENCCVQV
jgi:hypothetical protein